MSPSSGIEFIARGVLLYEGHVLLCKSIAGGYFYLPGGHVEPGEEASRACAREFLEEIGFEPKIGRCLLVKELFFTQKGKPKHEITVVFHVEHVFPGGTGDSAPPPLKSQEDHLAFEWVPIASVVDLDIRPQAMKAWLASGGVVARNNNQDRVTGCDRAIAGGPEWISVRES